MWEWQGDDPREPFDQERANSLVGKYIMIGITHRTLEGLFLYREQLHGVIVSAAPGGITVALRGLHEGEFWVMPPELEFLEPARPGLYALHASGEMVRDPDLFATWNMDEPMTQ